MKLRLILFFCIFFRTKILEEDVPVDNPIEDMFQEEEAGQGDVDNIID